MNFFGPILLVMFGVTVVSFSRHAQAFRFEDLEKVNAVEQAELLDLARLALELGRSLLGLRLGALLQIGRA